MQFIIRNDQDDRSFLVWGTTNEICRARADRRAKALGWNIELCSSERIEKDRMKRELALREKGTAQ